MIFDCGRNTIDPGFGSVTDTLCMHGLMLTLCCVG